MSERITKINLDVEKFTSILQDLNSRFSHSMPRAEHEAYKEKTQMEIEKLSNELKESNAIRSLVEDNATKIGEIEVAEVGRTSDLLRSMEGAKEMWPEWLQRVAGIESRITDLGSRMNDQVDTMKLQSTVIDLQSQQSNMISQSEIDGHKEKICELEARLAQSRPVREVDDLSSRIQELEARLSSMVDKASVDDLQERIVELETSLSETIPKSEASAQSIELEARIDASNSENQALKYRITDLQSELESTIPRIEAENRVVELEEKLRELQQAIDNLQTNVAEGDISTQTELGRRFQFGGVHADATTVAEFRDRLSELGHEEIEKFLRGGDFERWLGETMGEVDLAYRVSCVRAGTCTGDELKNQLLQVLQSSQSSEPELTASAVAFNPYNTYSA